MKQALELDSDLHPEVKKILDQVDGHDCPACQVMGRLNWQIIKAAAIIQAATCEHCFDAPEMVSFLQDLVAVHKKGLDPFDLENFKKWCKIAATYAFDETLRESKKSDFVKGVQGHTCKPGTEEQRKIGQLHSAITCESEKTGETVVKTIIHHHRHRKADPLFTLIEYNLPKMVEAILQTEKKDVEHGFCGTGKVIEGSEHALDLPYCPEKLHFHTHTSGAPYPSDIDFDSSSKANALTECIGTSKGVSCFSPHGHHRVYQS